MKVQHVIQMSHPQHTIEVGDSSYDNGSERTIRNRWDTPSGGFSPHASSEIPVSDVEHIIEAGARYDELEVKACLRMIAALTASVLRRTP